MSGDKKLLRTLYYSPTTLYTSVNSLYNAVKQKGIKLERCKRIYTKTRVSTTI